MDHEIATWIGAMKIRTVLEGARKEFRSRRGSPTVGCSPCTARVTNVEHHEEVSCTGRRALVCTRVLGPHNVLDTIGHLWLRDDHYRVGRITEC